MTHPGPEGRPLFLTPRSISIVPAFLVGHSTIRGKVPKMSEKRKRVAVSVSLPPDIAESLDDLRGSVGRSEYIQKALVADFRAKGVPIFNGAPVKTNGWEGTCFGSRNGQDCIKGAGHKGGCAYPGDEE